MRPELDLVEDEDQITHEMSLEDKHDPQVKGGAGQNWWGHAKAAPSVGVAQA